LLTGALTGGYVGARIAAVVPERDRPLDRDRRAA
jgi:hypothetical protein